MIAFHRKRAIIYSIGALAQLGARYIRIVEAVGSNPICSTAAGPGGIRDLFYTLRSRIFISLIYSEIKLWILLIHIYPIDLSNQLSAIRIMPDPVHSKLQAPGFQVLCRFIRHNVN